MLPHTKAKLILVLYLLLAPILAYLSYQFIQSTDSQFAAPKNTLVRDSQEIAGELMTTQIFHNPLFFVVTSANGSALVSDDMNFETAPLCQLGSFVEYLQHHPDKYHTPGIISVKWYCKYAQFPEFARQLVSKDNLTALVAVDLSSKSGFLGAGTTSPSHTIDAVNNYMMSTMSKIDPNLQVKSTSIEQVFSDLKNGLLGDLLLIDAIAIPLATTALALCLRSFRMIIIPLPSVILSVTLTFSFLYPVAKSTSVSSFAPEFVMGCLLALSIDFSLFIATRFRERIALSRLAGLDLKDHRVQAKIVWDTTVLTSHNILVSGITVAIALLSLMIVPIGTVATIGLAFAIGAICTVAVALTFQPCLLLTFFEFFSRDPCFNILLRYVPFMKRFFGDDMLLENGIHDELDEDGENNKKSLPILESASPSQLTQPSSNLSNVPTSLTLEDTAHLKNDSSLTNANADTTPYKSKPNSQLAATTKGKKDSSSNTSAVNSSSNYQPVPSLNNMFHRKDLIQYRGSQMMFPSSNVSSSQHLEHGNNLPTGINNSSSQYLHFDNNNNNGPINEKDEKRIHAEDAARRAQERSFWFRSARWVVSHPFLTLLLVALVGTPFCWLSSRTKITFDMFLQVPQGSPHVSTLFTVANHIGDGSLSTPFYITVDTGKKDGIAEIRNVTITNKTTHQSITEPVFFFNSEFWTEMQRLVNHFEVSVPQPREDMMSIVSVPGVPANFSFSSLEADALINCARLANYNSYNSNNAIDKDLQLCLEYQLLFNHTIDASRRMALIVFAPPLNPFGTSAYDYCTAIDNAIASFHLNQTSKSISKIGFFGASASSWAILHKMIELLPLQLGIMLLVIFLVCFAVFRTIFVPLSMIATVAFPVAVALGIGVLFFQVSPLNKIWPIEVTAYSWLVPEFSFSLLCGLSLDYSIFLLTRVIEYKTLGFTNEAAMIKAVYKTSRTISFAGIIMTFSFGGMIFSDVMMMRQFGAISSIAVLIDCFVMRPIAVPALLTILSDKIVWWPRKFGDEENTRDENDMTEARGINGDDDEDDETNGDSDYRAIDNNNENETNREDESYSGSKMSSNLVGRKAKSVPSSSVADYDNDNNSQPRHHRQNSTAKNSEHSYKSSVAERVVDNEFDYGTV